MYKPTLVLARLLTAVILLCLPENAPSQVLYQNTSNYLGNFNTGNGELGNSVSLAGAAPQYFITGFDFQFDFSGLLGAVLPIGAERADLRIYQNDGAPVLPSGKPSPGTMIYDSGPFPIGGFTTASRVLFGPIDLGGGVLVPQNFTWTVVFSGLPTNETAGLGLYSVAVVGTNYNEAWLNTGTNWQLLMSQGANPPPDFGALITGQPVPALQISGQSNSIVLSWPTNAVGFTLQVAPNLLPPIHWNSLSGSVVINGQNVVTNSASGISSFYRLLDNTAPDP